jgi:CheY-like chemotaxis protein
MRPRRPRVLIVDDEPTMLEILRETLEAEHYEVFTAANGEEALGRVYRDFPDLVLTDLRMPVMDGLELLRRLRGDLSTCQIPVVFLTVVGDMKSELQALDLGADDYIGKPLERGRLLSRVRRALFRAHLMRAVPS